MWSYTQAENNLKIIDPKGWEKQTSLFKTKTSFFCVFWRPLIFWLDLFVGLHVIFHRPNLIPLMVGGYRRHLRNLLNRLIARWFQMVFIFTPQNWGKIPNFDLRMFFRRVGLKTKPPTRMARIFHLWHLECVGTTVITGNDWQLLKVSFRGYPALNLEDFWNLHPRKNQS